MIDDTLPSRFVNSHYVLTYNILCVTQGAPSLFFDKKFNFENFTFKDIFGFLNWKKNV